MNPKQKPLVILLYIFSAQLLGLIFFALYTSRPLTFIVREPIQNDFWDFYVGVNLFLRHMDPYLRHRLYTPPSSLLIALPFAFTPWMLSAFLYFCANCALLLSAITKFSRLIGLDSDDVHRMQILTLTYYPFHFLIARGNIDGITVSLVILAFCSQNAFRPLLLGLSVAMKVYPGILIATALRQKRIRFAVIAVLAFLAVQAPFIRLEYSFLSAIVGRGKTLDLFENVGVFTVFNAIFHSSAKAIFGVFWISTLAFRLYRDRSSVEPELWTDYVPWMVSVPLLIFPYEYVFLLPVIAVFTRRYQLGRVTGTEGLVFTGFILTGVPSLAFSSEIVTTFYGLQLINAAGLLIIMLGITFAPTFSASRSEAPAVNLPCKVVSS